jgi:hypothetical protein
VAPLNMSSQEEEAFQNAVAELRAPMETAAESSDGIGGNSYA